jgi:hypothetical protein
VSAEAEGAGSGSDRAVPAVAEEVISSIIAATGLQPPAHQEKVERLEAYLSAVILNLARKAPTRKALGPAEMRKVGQLHDKFDALLRSFQGAGNPPPMLPWTTLESGTPVTPWTHWMDGLAFAGQGRPEQLNRGAVGELLAIYEQLFERTAVAENAELGESAAVRFIRACLRAVRERVPPERVLLAPWYYQVPSVSSLNGRMDHLRKHELRFGRERVSRFLGSASQ